SRSGSGNGCSAGTRSRGASGAATTAASTCGPSWLDPATDTDSPEPRALRRIPQLSRKGSGGGMARRQGGSRVWSHTATLVVLVVGLGVTAALRLGARLVTDSNERGLLRQRARESGDVLSATIQSLQTPLASAAEVAEAPDANSQRVGRLLTPIVSPNSIFVSAAVWS